MAEHFSDLSSYINLQIPSILKNSKEDKTQRNLHQHIFLKSKVKKSWKPQERNNTLSYLINQGKIMDITSEPWRPEEKWRNIYHVLGKKVSIQNSIPNKLILQEWRKNQGIFRERKTKRMCCQCIYPKATETKFLK